MSWSFLSINAALLHGLGLERFSGASALLIILQLTSASAILNQHISNRFFFVGKVRGGRSARAASTAARLHCPPQCPQHSERDDH